jgi:uncharacterized protein involved in response to NO
MSQAQRPRTRLAELPAILSAAPHRLAFLAGAANVLLAMLWWAGWLIAARWGYPLPQPPLPGGWAHALIMQYQVLPSFIFGFLLTVFPRWMGLPDLGRRHYLPVGAGLLLGQLLTLVGLLGFATALHIGVVLTLLAWLFGAALFGRLLLQEKGRTWHARSAFAGVVAGTLGWAAFAAYLHGAPAQLVLASIKLGTFALLLPIFVTVAHRMFPFFAANVVPGYASWRPLSWLAAFWGFVLLHLALELLQLNPWLWLADLPLLALSLWWCWRTWPRGPAPALLRVLFLGFAWLPLAWLLYAVQSLTLLLGGAFILDRAPAHALYVGFFGSLLVAMVTRVTQGHSGRALELGVIPALTFIAIQLVAATRIASELMSDAYAWHALTASAWVLAFLPWALRSAWIYLTPRLDRRPG